ARLARRLNRLPFAAALTARALRNELAERGLPHGSLHPGSAAAVARHDQGAGCCTGSLTSRAGGEMLEGDLALGTGEGFLERHLQGVAQIGAAHRAVAARLLRLRAGAEKHIEDVAETFGAEAAERPRPRSGLAVDARDAVLIVKLALLRIAQHRIR